MLEFSKAFDIVPHNRLALTKDLYGVHRNALNWIPALLSNRSQRVVLKGEASDTVKETTGVPWGVCIGIIYLYIIYFIFIYIYIYFYSLY